MTHNTIYSDDSVRACSEIIRTSSANMHHERTTSAALLSTMLEQDSVPALRSQETGVVRPTSTGMTTSAQREALRTQTLSASVLPTLRSKERHQKLKVRPITAIELAPSLTPQLLIPVLTPS